MLNYGYVVLESEVRKTINTVELDYFIRFLHEINQSRTSLVYDIQGLFRWLIDVSVIQLLEEKKEGNFDKSDIYYPCNQIDSAKNAEATTLCYRYQANYFLIQTDYDLQSACSLCSGIPDYNYIPICYKGVAAYLTKDNFDDLDKTQLTCMSTPVKYQEQCVISATESLTRFVSEDKAQEFCQKRLDDELQETCQSRKDLLLDSWFE